MKSFIYARIIRNSIIQFVSEYVFYDTEHQV